VAEPARPLRRKRRRRAPTHFTRHSRTIRKEGLTLGACVRVHTLHYFWAFHCSHYLFFSTFLRPSALLSPFDLPFRISIVLSTLLRLRFWRACSPLLNPSFDQPASTLETTNLASLQPSTNRFLPSTREQLPTLRCQPTAAVIVTVSSRLLSVPDSTHILCHVSFSISSPPPKTPPLIHIMHVLDALKKALLQRPVEHLRPEEAHVHRPLSHRAHEPDPAGRNAAPRLAAGAVEDGEEVPCVVESRL
jgi:hypothetical protein